jgi:hypothetical protein
MCSNAIPSLPAREPASGARIAGALPGRTVQAVILLFPLYRIHSQNDEVVIFGVVEYPPFALAQLAATSEY